MTNRIARLAVLVLLCGLPLAQARADGTYYLSLGDSLAQGIQPVGPGGADIPTNQGYADDLFAVLHQHVPDLNLVKLGCPGETTVTMLNGNGPCTALYMASSGVTDQLDAAVNFLQTHQVALVTLDIGANDVDGCVSLTAAGGIDQTCLANGLTAVALNLPRILTELRAAAGPQTQIIAMNYYDPFLAAWLLGSVGQTLARQSLLAATTGLSSSMPGLNTLLATVYQEFGVPLADVADAFHISSFATVPILNIPLNVFLTLSWTWTSHLPPDIHANSSGYQIIALTFVGKILMLK